MKLAVSLLALAAVAKDGFKMLAEMPFRDFGSDLDCAVARRTGLGGGGTDCAGLRKGVIVVITFANAAKSHRLQEFGQLSLVDMLSISLYELSERGMWLVEGREV
jgi:hypothetical protein